MVLTFFRDESIFKLKNIDLFVWYKREVQNVFDFNKEGDCTSETAKQDAETSDFGV